MTVVAYMNLVPFIKNTAMLSVYNGMSTAFANSDWTTIGRLATQFFATLINFKAPGVAVNLQTK
jgi:hypothetical protein